jgi:hypothetical protein
MRPDEANLELGASKAYADIRLQKDEDCIDMPMIEIGSMFVAPEGQTHFNMRTESILVILVVDCDRYDSRRSAICGNARKFSLFCLSQPHGISSSRSGRDVR